MVGTAQQKVGHLARCRCAAQSPPPARTLRTETLATHSMPPALQAFALFNTGLGFVLGILFLIHFFTDDGIKDATFGRDFGYGYSTEAAAIPLATFSLGVVAAVCGVSQLRISHTMDLDLIFSHLALTFTRRPSPMAGGVALCLIFAEKPLPALGLNTLCFVISGICFMYFSSASKIHAIERSATNHCSERGGALDE